KTHPEPIRRRLPRRTLVLVGSLVLAGVAAVGWSALHRRGPDRVPESTPAPIACAEPALATAASSVVVAPAPEPVPPAARPASVIRARPPSLQSNRAARCNPPYTVDRSGVHIMKPECL